MRKAALFLALAVALTIAHNVPTYADASQQGCISSDYRAAGCVNPNTPTANVPEPGTLGLLGLGLVSVGGWAIVLRRERPKPAKLAAGRQFRVPPCWMKASGLKSKWAENILDCSQNTEPLEFRHPYTMSTLRGGLPLLSLSKTSSKVKRRPSHTQRPS